MLLSVDPVWAAQLQADGFQPIQWRGQEVYVQPGEWIIRLDGLRGTPARQLQAANALLNRTPLGIRAKRHLGNDGVFLVKAPGQPAYKNLLSALSKVPGFKYVEPNFALWATGQPTQAVNPSDDLAYSALWALKNIQAEAAWGLASGTGVTVAVIDSGVQLDHRDLAANIWTNPLEIPNNGIDDDGNGYVDDVHGWDFVSKDNDPQDDVGHGTHVAGTIAAVDNQIGVIGMAPSARIMPLKFLGANGSGTTENAILAINYARDNGAMLTNNSWGGGGYSQALYDAIAATRDANMLFIAAAGNGDKSGTAIDTDASPFYPASYNLDNIISVAATDSNDLKTSWSNYGATSVDLGAPGLNIYSTLPGDDYNYLSGTSMAAPHVSAVAALALSLKPGSSYAAVRDAIFAGVDPVASLAGQTVTGGRLNAYGTLLKMQSPPPEVEPPTAPSGLSATDVSYASVSLTWSDNSTNEEGFQVLRSDGDASVTWTLLPNSTRFTDTTVKAGTTYSYTIVAFNSAGDAPSTALEVTTPAAPVDQAPAAPIGLTVSALSRDSIKLTWLDNSNNEAGFKIERSSNGRKWSQIAVVGPNAIQYVDTGLRKRTTYYYRVRAYNNVGDSPYSNPASTVTPASAVSPTAFSLLAIAPAMPPAAPTALDKLPGSSILDALLA